MLYHVYLILVVMYFVFIILATLTKKGGYALLGLLDLYVVVWASTYFLQVPYSPELNVHLENVTAVNTTSLLENVPRILPTGFVFDPVSGMLFLPWVFITIVIYGWCVEWGRRWDRGWF